MKNKFMIIKKLHLSNVFVSFCNGINFLTRSTCVIMDARSNTCKSNDFIPRYDKSNVTLWVSFGKLASESTTVWRYCYQDIFPGT